MTRKSARRLDRDRRQIPHPDQIAAINFARDRGQLIVTKKNMLENQIYRDGPIIARSFDAVAKPHIKAASELYAMSAGMLMRHLPGIDDNGFKATASRLLLSASNTITASIEVGRHGFPRQSGVLARTVIETLATVIALTIKADALEQFYAGTLQSNKCVGWAKDVIEPIGHLYGWLSNQFVHIGTNHSSFESPSRYKIDDPSWFFVINSMKLNVWMLHVVCELAFHDEIQEPAYWRVVRAGEVVYQPSEEVRAWADAFLTPLE